MYAENYIYSPSIIKAEEIIRAKKNRILYMVGEDSIHGSTTALSSQWRNVGGGSMIRLSCHPLSAILFLKQVEAEVQGKTITIKSVTADTGAIVTNLTEHERRHLPSNPIDVEDFSTIIVTFSDGSKAIIIGNDNTMGGIKNYVNVFANDGVIECRMTPADNMMTYFMDQEGLDDVYISEQLNQKTGWNSVCIAEETLRGYSIELQDFIECAAYGRKPKSGLNLAYDTIKIIYAAYKSAEEGRRIDF
jgi:predicted dehydrogenase